tara:strand:- start:196 stop:423 length:228 start_codon:yes stop_codon:yes gene_type:complete
MSKIIDFPNSSPEAARRIALSEFEEAMRVYELSKREERILYLESKRAKTLLIFWILGAVVGSLATILAISIISST